MRALCLLPGQSGSQLTRWFYNSFFAWGREILCATIHSFKGLERRVVIVIELDEELLGSSASRDALCYVAFSRPRNHLILFGKKDVILEVLPRGD
jgi:superfamily I DNA/RNA helicase